MPENVRVMNVMDWGAIRAAEMDTNANMIVDVVIIIVLRILVAEEQGIPTHVVHVIKTVSVRG